MSDALSFSPEYEAAQQRLEELSTEYAALISEFTELTDVVRKNIETEYMMQLGRKEFQLYSLKVEALQLKREIALYQAAKNQGKRISSREVAEVIQKEFTEYQSFLKEHQQKVQEAEKHFAAEKLTAEQSKALHDLYHKLVKKLHPDLHPDLPPKAMELWNRIVQAYKENSWSSLCLLADMTDEFLAGKGSLDTLPGTMDALKEKVQTLTTKRDALKEKIQSLWHCPPLSYAELLKHPSEVLQKRNELDQMIADFTANIEILKTLRDNLMN